MEAACAQARLALGRCLALALAAPAVRAALAMRLAVLAALARCLAALPVVVWQPPASYALLPTL